MRVEQLLDLLADDVVHVGAPRWRYERSSTHLVARTLT
jgi:hypothetical protein